jgi:hypothetical protein
MYDMLSTDEDGYDEAVVGRLPAITPVAAAIKPGMRFKAQNCRCPHLLDQ